MNDKVTQPGSIEGFEDIGVVSKDTHGGVVGHTWDAVGWKFP